MKRRSFTLMEVMISLFLLGVLLFALFTPLKNYIRDKLEIDTLKMQTEEKQRLHLRLSHLFQLPSGAVTLNDGALRITAMKKLDHDPLLTGPILAELRLSQSELHLLLSPLNREEKSVARDEILMEGVDKLGWRFFGKSGWQSDCMKEKPLFVELKLLRGKETMTFIYEL